MQDLQASRNREILTNNQTLKDQLTQHPSRGLSQFQKGYMKNLNKHTQYRLSTSGTSF